MITFAALRVVEGPRQAKELRIPAGTTAILGRGEDCWEILDPQDLTAGRHHCRLVIEDTRVLLEDLHSLNGTFVNSHRLDPAQGPVQLLPGDLIRIGRSTLCFGLGREACCQSCGRVVAHTSQLDFGTGSPEALYCRQCWDASQLRGGAAAVTRVESRERAEGGTGIPSHSGHRPAVVQTNDTDLLNEYGYQTVLEIPSTRSRRTLVVRRGSGKSRHVARIIPVINADSSVRVVHLIERLQAFRHPSLLLWEEMRASGPVVLAVRPYLRDLPDPQSPSALASSSSILNFQILLPRLVALAEALSALHGAGLSHGNISLSNLYLDLDRPENPKPRCLLIDYGLNGLTAEITGQPVSFQKAAQADVAQTLLVFRQLLTAGGHSALDPHHPAAAWLGAADRGEFRDAESLVLGLRNLQSALVRLTIVK